VPSHNTLYKLFGDAPASFKNSMSSVTFESMYLYALVARYGGAQNVSVEQYVKEFTKPIETKTETGEKGSGLTIALVIVALLYFFMSRRK